jgi:hypothetical protein
LSNYNSNYENDERNKGNEIDSKFDLIKDLNEYYSYLKALISEIYATKDKSLNDFSFKEHKKYIYQTSSSAVDYYKKNVWQDLIVRNLIIIPYRKSRSYKSILSLQTSTDGRPTSVCYPWQ